MCHVEVDLEKICYAVCKIYLTATSTTAQYCSGLESDDHVACSERDLASN